MTRQTRTLLVLGLFGVCGVLALGAMARRYATLLEARVGTKAPAESAAEAERRVNAFVVARERVAEEVARSAAKSEDERRQRLEQVLTQALAREALSRDEYERIAGMLAAWERDGTPPASPYLSPLARRRAYLKELPGADLP
jgi:uncharacterized protein YdiU (UPF0061 family)